jgi:hypothetical protein
MRSRRHRWIERVVAFGGGIYWLITTYLGLAFAAALVTTLTLLSSVRVVALFSLFVAGFAALAAHRWRPTTARIAHWAMALFAAIYLGTCVELVEFPASYVAFDYRGVRVEYATEFAGVARDQAQIRDLIDQVYARSGVTAPASPLRVRFVSAGSGAPVVLGPGTSDSASADVVLSTDRGGLRGSSFLLEASFLLTERLVWLENVSTLQSVANGYAYWTMLGVRPRPDWATGYLQGTNRARCADLSRVALGQRPRGELTIWISPNQDALHLEVAPFIDAERTGGERAARDLLVQARGMNASDWRALIQAHCAP